MKQAVLITLVAIIFSLGSGTAFAAKSKCKYEHNAVDKFSKKLIVNTKWGDISHPMRPTGREMTGFVFAGSRGEERFLTVKFEYLRWKKTFPTDNDILNTVSIPAGSELLISMADGSIVTLYASQDATGETNYKTPKPGSGNKFEMMSIAAIEYELDDQSIAALTATEAHAVRIKTAAGNRDVRIHSGGTDNIQNAINCLSEALQGAPQ